MGCYNTAITPLHAVQSTADSKLKQLRNNDTENKQS